MKHANLWFWAFIVCLTSCVSTSRYQTLNSRSEHLQLHNAELKKENDSLQTIAGELHSTREQLAKTENVLIEFYQKYQDRPVQSPVLTSNQESQWDTVELEINRLIKENSKLHDEIRHYQQELTALKNHQAGDETKQASAREKNRTIAALNNQIEEFKSNQKKFKSESANKDAEIGNLKKELAELRSWQKENKSKSGFNEYLIDSLQSEIQYLNIKNKGHLYEIAELKEKYKETDPQFTEQQNAEVIRLHDELKNANAKVFLLENEKAILATDLSKRNEEYTRLQQKLDNLNAKSLDAEKEKNELASNRSKRNDEISVLQKRIDDLIAKNEVAEQDKNELIANLTKRNEEINLLQQTMDKLNAKSAEAEKEKNELASNRSKRNEEISLLQQRIDDLNAKNATSENEKNELISNLSKKNEEISLLQQTIKDLNLKGDASEQSKKELAANLSKRNEEISLLQQALAENKILIDEQKSKLEEKSKKKDDVNQKKIIEDLKADLDRREKSLSALHDVISSKNEEIKTLKNENAEKTEQVTALQLKLSNAEESRNTDLQKAIDKNQVELAKKDLAINAIQLQRDSLTGKLKDKDAEIQNSVVQNQMLDKEIASKNRQIEELGTRLSEKSSENANLLKLKPLRDSITYFTSETLRLKQVNKSLESEIKRNQNALVRSDDEIDSLKSVIRMSGEKVKEFTVDETIATQLREDLKKEKNENASLRKRIDSMKVNQTKSNNIAKPSLVKIPAALTEKIKNFISENSNAGVMSYSENESMQIVLPQSYVFEGEGIAMTQAGTELISNLCSILKPYNDVKIKLTGYGATDATGKKTFESSYKRANTVYKLMSVSGMNSNIIKVESVLSPEGNKQKMPPAGVEIMVHAE